VDNLLLVDVVQPLADFADDRTDLGILHAVAFPQHAEQLPPRAVLDQQVDVLLVAEVPVEGSDVAVRQEEVDAQLAGDLILVFLLFYLLLRHYLQTTEEACLFVLYQHYLAVLALPQLFADCEV
jgi:hypothetical protein